MAKVTMKERKENLAAVLTENEGQVLDAGLIEKIKGVFGSAAAVSKKVDENGNVYCTYFGEYLPADEFATNNKGKLDSMCGEGKKLHRTQKSMVNKASTEVLKQYRAGDIEASEMDSLLSTIEANASHKFPRGTETIPADYPFSV